MVNATQMNLPVHPRPTGAPQVAVIVPAYGVADLVDQAIQSLLLQSLTDWECIIIDDGAPDDVAGAVHPYLDDPRFRFLATDNRGVSAARNRAIAEAHAPYIALLDGDDLFRPTYLQQMVAALNADPDAQFVTCNARIFGAVAKERYCFETKQGTGDGRIGSLSDVLDRSFGVYIGSTFRRRDFEAIGGFDETMTHAEDFDFWVRLLLLGGHARYQDEVLGEYRVRPGSASASGAGMIRGNLSVYEKALEQLGSGPDAGVAHRMIAMNHALLAFEEALSQVETGDLEHGLPALREAGRGNGGIAWAMSFLLWRILPSLAPPMLRWRRKGNSRGVADITIPPLIMESSSGHLPSGKEPA